jgi:hypothetical protein
MLWDWLGANWIDVLETIGLVIAIMELRENTKSRRLSNLLSLTKGNREIWSLTLQLPGLKRVIATDRDIQQEPLSFEEREFINLVILHVKTAFEALKDGMPGYKKGIMEDIRGLFALPTVSQVWTTVKSFYEPAFRAFVEKALLTKD